MNKEIEILEAIYDATEGGKYVKITLKTGESINATMLNWTEIDVDDEEDVLALRLLKDDGDEDTLVGRWIESFEIDG